MRSVFLSAAKSLPDESSEELELKCKEIINHSYDDLIYSIETLELTSSSSDDIISSLKLINSACYTNDKTNYFHRFTNPQIKKLAEILTTIYGTHNFNVLTLKCILNSTAVLPTSMVFTRMEGFKLLLKDSLFSENFQEIQYALVTLFNIFYDIGPTNQKLLEDSVNIHLFYSPENLNRIFNSTERFSRRCVKELIDLASSVTFEVTEIAETLAKNLLETAKFQKEIFTFFNTILLKNDRKYSHIQSQINEFLLNNYKSFILSYSNSVSFLQLLITYLSRAPQALKQDLIWKNDVIFDIITQKPQNASKQLQIELISEIFHHFPSSLESQNTPKLNIYNQILARCTCDSIGEICSIFTQKASEIAFYFPEVFQNFMQQLNQVIIVEKFRENSLEEGSEEHRAAVKIVDFLVGIVEVREECGSEVGQYVEVVDWLERFALVDLEGQFNVNLILRGCQ